MKFASSICLITEDDEKLSKFYDQVLQTKADINTVHVNVVVDGGGITIYAKASALRPHTLLKLAWDDLNHRKNDDGKMILGNTL